jgi:hypothetical protein
LSNKKISEFVKNNLTKEDKSFTQSFMYHLCRISTSKVKQEAYYSKKDLKKFNVDELTGKIITDSLEELQEFYASFQNQQISPKPLNAVTKSGPFEDFISAELVKKYQMKKNK